MRANSFVSGWRGVVLIAAVYVYFLIFAQFAFLARLSQLGINGSALKIVMAAMAAGGILLSLLIPLTAMVRKPAASLRVGFAISAVAALISLLGFGINTAVVVAFLIGAGMGITTVTLVTHLRKWTGERGGILHVGIGTGLAYLICNLPAVFTATPQIQAILAASVCAAAMLLPLESTHGTVHAMSDQAQIPFAIALTSFAALIWLDSAAFYIIQHTSSLKAGTWFGSVHLWANGALHLVSAIAAASLLQRRRTAVTLALAFSALAFACVLLTNASLILSASLFYPVGVSFYSVALVAYPSFLAQADSTADRAKQAGWIYAIAGWIGSAMGIGMGQNLGHVPLAFVAASGAVVLGPISISVWKARARELGIVTVIGVIAFIVYRILPEPASAALTSAERGRQIYISEGCISCHSQYVRPDSPDVLMWGPAESMEELHAQKPPLIGNRRQGPDLSQVGRRRSRLWLKAHLISPAEISYHSPMPSFALLFADSRGDDLVNYLASLRGGSEEQQLERETAWSPSGAAVSGATAGDGQIVYEHHCATCHDARGLTRLHWLGEWHKVPQTLAELRAYCENQSQSKIAQIAKFGIPGTDMPGHEYLNDQQIASVSLWLKLAPMQTASQPSPHTGDHQ